MERLDYFGGQIHIRFKGFKTHKTKCGMLITIIMIAFITLHVSYLLNNFSIGRNPIVLFQERQVKNPKRFDIFPESFSMAFGIVGQDYSYFIDESVLNIESRIEIKSVVFNQTLQENEIVWTKKSFQMERCTKDHIINNTEILSEFVSLEQHFCLPKDLALHIEGEYNQDSFAQIIINVNKCKGALCKDDTVIEGAMKLFWGEVIFTDVYVSPENKDKPFTKYVRDIFWEVSQKFPKKIYMELRNNYVESDYGFLFSDSQTDIYPSYSQINEMVTNADEDTFSTFILRFEKKKENLYKRTYKNFLPIISELGGLLSVLSTIGILLTYYYTQTHLNQELINNTFTFQEKKNHNEKENETHLRRSKELSLFRNKTISQPIYKKGKIRDYTAESVSQLKKENLTMQSCNLLQYQNKKLTNISEKEKPTLKQEESPKIVQKSEGKTTPQSPIKQISNFLKQNKESPLILSENQVKTTSSPKLKGTLQNKQVTSHIDELINQNANSMKFNLFDYFISFFMKIGLYRKKKAIYDYSIQQLYHHLDIQWIINKLIDFDKLKRILLDDDQLLLFEYLPKPSICYSLENDSVQFHDNQSFTMSKKSKNEVDNIHRAVSSYKNMIEKQNKKQTDNRILNYLDSSYKEIFQDEYRSSFYQQSKDKKPQQQSQSKIKNQSYQQQLLDNKSELDEIKQDFFVIDDCDQINIDDNLKLYSSVYKASPNNSLFHSSLLQPKNNNTSNIKQVQN